MQHGIDTFDCVHPTRLARHGGALVQPSVLEDEKGREHMNLRNSRFRDDPRPIDEKCECQTCRTLSRSYLHHLLKAGELLAMQALTIHNVHFMNRLLKAIREAIATGTLEQEKKKWVG